MSIKPISLTLIVAATHSNAIGLSSSLPWRLPKEMAYFAAVTKHVSGASRALSAVGVEMNAGGEEEMNAVIMGRKSWEGIPTKFRPLAGRRNIVISRQEDFDLGTSPHSHLASSLPLALSLLSTALSPRLGKTFLIGGAQLYSHSMLHQHSSYLTDRILLTRVKTTFEGDAWFPEIRGSEEILNSLPTGEERGARGEEMVEGWTRCSHEEMVDWTGVETPEGDQMEVDRNSKREVVYEFQMWVRK